MQLQDVDIPYINRLPEESHSNMIQEWLHVLSNPDAPRLLLTGSAGIGKSRETLHLLEILEQQNAELGPLTILMARPDMDEPLEVPENLNLRNILLFVNDAHRMCKSVSSERFIHLYAQEADFHSRLQRVINFFEELVVGEGPFRILVTARSESQILQEIKPSHNVWRSFTVSKVPGLNEAQVDQASGVLSNYFNITILPEASQVIQKRNDGTFQSIIYYLKSEIDQGHNIITTEMVRTNYPGVLKNVWERRVYNRLIKPHPRRVAVFTTLDLLHQAGIPHYKEIVIELASRLSHSYFPLWWRRRQIKKDLEELQSWIKQSDSLLLCHETSFEGLAEISKNLDALLSTIFYSMNKSSELARKLFNPAFQLGMTLEQSGWFESVRRLNAQLVKHFKSNAFAHHLLAESLFWNNYLSEALEESDLTISLDPSNPLFFVTKGDVLAYMGKVKDAELSYLAALKMLSKKTHFAPYITYELAALYFNWGHFKQAEICLRQSLDIDPDYTSALVMLSDLYTLFNRTELADEYADRALQTKPKTTPGKLNLARVYLRYGRTSEARIILTQLQGFFDDREETSQGTVNLYEEFIYFYFQIGTPTEAIEAAKKCKSLASTLMSRHKDSPFLIGSFILASLVLKDIRGVTDLLNKAWSICPNYVLFVFGPAINRLANVAGKEFSRTFEAFIKTKIGETGERISSELSSHPTPAIYIEDTNLFDLLTKAYVERNLQIRAREMQRLLSEVQIARETDGVRVIMSGDQKLALLEIEGTNQEALINSINEVIRESQVLAAKMLRGQT